MVWQATVIAPSAAADVTVIVRVTYRSLEALCSDDYEYVGDEVALN